LLYFEISLSNAEINFKMIGAGGDGSPHSVGKRGKQELEFSAQLRGS